MAHHHHKGILGSEGMQENIGDSEIYISNFNIIYQASFGTNAQPPPRM